MINGPETNSRWNITKIKKIIFMELTKMIKLRSTIKVIHENIFNVMEL